MGDELFQQISNIAKAGAYDAIQPHYAEMQKQNTEFRKAFKSIQDLILNTDVKELMEQPINFIQKVNEICLNTLRDNKTSY